MLTPKQKEIELLAEVNYYNKLLKVDFIVSVDGDISNPPILYKDKVV